MKLRRLQGMKYNNSENNLLVDCLCVITKGFRDFCEDNEE